MDKDKEIIVALLESVGITINGKNDFDIKVHNDKLYSRVLKQGALGLGESYMDGWWDCRRLDEFFYKIMDADLDKKVRGDWKLLLKLAPNYILNAGRKSKAFHIGEHHYDLGNDLYTVMLDKRMTYTCGFWKDAKNLDEAQEAKLEMVCKKIGLSKGQKVLDIGSGWGSFIGYAAEKHCAHAVGVTVSKEQKNTLTNVIIIVTFRPYSRIIEMFKIGLTTWYHSACLNMSAQETTALSCKKYMIFFQTMGFSYYTLSAVTLPE